MAGIPKEQAEKFLSKVPEEYVFRCQDGQILRDIKELAEALTTLTRLLPIIQMSKRKISATG